MKLSVNTVLRPLKTIVANPFGEYVKLWGISVLAPSHLDPSKDVWINVFRLKDRFCKMELHARVWDATSTTNRTSKKLP